jgi:hypothetical protein
MNVINDGGAKKIAVLATAIIVTWYKKLAKFVVGRVQDFVKIS